MWFKLYTKFFLIIPTLLGVPVHTGVDIGGSSGTRWEPELFHRCRGQASFFIFSQLVGQPNIMPFSIKRSASTFSFLRIKKWRMAILAILVHVD